MEESETTDIRAPLPEKVVVTATRIEEPAGRTGSTVTVITDEEIERKQYRYVIEALTDVPGVDIRQNGGPGTTASVFIRGTDSDHTLVLLDGVELNDPASPSRVPILSLLTTEGIERIEVLRGPQSTLYGADAIGGVIQIFTRRGAGKPSTSVGAEAGSFSTFRSWLQSAGGSERFRYSVTASRTGLEGFSAKSDGVENDGYRNLTGTGQITWNPNETFGFDVITRLTDDRAEFDGFSQEEDHRIDGRMEVLKLQPRLSLYGGRWRQRFGAQVARHERNTTSTFPSLVRGELRTLDWQNDVTIGAVHTLVLGLERENEQARFETYDADATNLAAYVQDSMSLGKRGFATVGVRFDDHSIYSGESTYRVTGGYEFPTATTVRASVGTGFKAPSLSQLDPNGFAGNPELEPERSVGYEVGLDQAGFDRRLLFGLTLYRNLIDNLIISAFNSATGGFLNLNLDEARTQGLETYLQADVGGRVTILTNYTFTDTEALGTPAGFGLEEGSELLRRPRHKANLDVHTRVLGDKLGITFGGRYVGTRSDLDPVTFTVTDADSYRTLRLALDWNATATLRVTGRADNLLDEGYENVLGFQAPGRSGYVGLAFIWPPRTAAGAAGGSGR